VATHSLACALACAAACLAGTAATIDQDAIVARPDTIVTEGVPDIPRRIGTAMTAYARFRNAVFVAWHPTRREMLVGTTFGDTQQIHYVAAPGAARTQLTFFEDGIGGGQRRVPIDASFQPVTGDYFVFEKDTDGKERYQLHMYDRESGAISRLTDGESINDLGAWSHAGDRLAFTSTKRSGRDYDLYVMDPLDPRAARLVAQVEGAWTVADWTADDGALLALEHRSAAESRLWRVDVRSGDRTALTPPGGTSFAGAVLAPDGRSAYVTTDADSEYLRLARLDLVTSELTRIGRDLDGDVEQFAVAPDGRTVALVVNEQGRGVLRLVDLQNGATRPVSGLPVGRVTRVAWHRNGVDLAVELASVRSDGDVYSLHVPTGRIERWTFSETGGVNPEALVEPELVRWKSFDGLTITGYIYRPPRRFTGRRPVVVNIHGGPEAQERPRWQGRSNYLLNEMGVAILYPNVRGSTGFGKSFMGLDDGMLREGPTKDIGALLDWVAAQPDLDPDRVMVTGASFGGYLALAVAAEYNDRIRCTFAGFPVSNLATQLQETDPARQAVRRREYGDERDPPVRQFLERIAPLNNAEKIRKPLFVAHGRNDTRVPIAESQRIIAAMKANGTPVWYLEATNEGHGIGRRSNLDYLMNAWVLFMEAWLLK